MLRRAILLLFLMLLPSAACAEARLALLIGNQGYNAKVGRLKNPHNDIGLVGAALKSLRFAVTEIKDADYKAVDTAIKRHVQNLRREGPGAISFVYYSGHGAADPDTKINYLIPIDVANADDEDLWTNSLNLNKIVETLRELAPAATHYVVFDACRNELNLTRKGRKALTDKGFVPIIAYTPGVMIAYATAPGKTAADTGSDGGPYAKALADEIVKPGLEAMYMFRRVALRVNREIGQDPWMSSSTLPEVFLAGNAAPTPPATSPQALANVAERAWQWVKDSMSVTILEDFARQFEGTEYGAKARARIEDLKKQQVALAQPPVPNPTPAPPVKPAVSTTPAAPGRCIEVAVGKGSQRRCITPGAGKSQWFKDCDTCPDLVLVPSGTFTMGSPAGEEGRDEDEGPQRSVRIAGPLAVGRYAVTFEEWDACVAAGGCNGYQPGEQGWGRGRLPVINVSWHHAKAYVAWLSQSTGKTYRLLSEAEREYVARAGTTTPYWWGSSISMSQANYSAGAQVEVRRATVPVENFSANAWGLFQMHGNVWEWVEDCWNGGYAGAPLDATARADGDCTRRVIRGGSWNVGARHLRSAARMPDVAEDQFSGLGIRVARSLEP